MGLRQIMDREASEDKMTISNSRWEEVDGQNQYISDEKITVAADKRCLGYRQGRGYNSQGQCSSRAVVRTGGHLCKKCFDDFVGRVDQEKNNFITTVGTRTPDADGEKLYRIYMGLDENDLPSNHWVNSHSHYGRNQPWAKLYDEWGIESYLQSVGEQSPTHWKEVQLRSRRQRVNNYDNLLLYRPNYSDGLTAKVDTLVLYLSGKTTAPWDNVPSRHYIKTISLEEIVWEDERGNASDENKKHTQDYLDGLVVDSRFALGDLLNLQKALKKHASELKAWNKKQSSLRSAITQVHEDVCDRPYPWEDDDSKPNLTELVADAS